MKICISASQRFAQDIKRISEMLVASGAELLLPAVGITPEMMTPEMVSRLVFDHFKKIDVADIVLVINPGGYIGNSVKVEIGYAKGAGKKVIFTEATGQSELDCLANEIIEEADLKKIFSEK